MISHWSLNDIKFPGLFSVLCCRLDGLYFYSYLEVFQSLSQSFRDCSKWTNYNWYHSHLHVPLLFLYVPWVFHWSQSYGRSPQVLRTLLRILLPLPIFNNGPEYLTRGQSRCFLQQNVFLRSFFFFHLSYSFVIFSFNFTCLIVSASNIPK